MSGGVALAAVGLQLLADGPSDGRDLTPVTVSPGLGGFIAMFALVVVTVLLILDMTRRIRRVNARARVEERHRLEDAEAAAGDGGHSGPDDGSGQEPPAHA